MEPNRFKDFERLTWLNYWTPELWALRRGGEPFKIDLTPYSDALIESAYDGVENKEKMEALKSAIAPAWEDCRGKFVRLNRRSPKDYTDGRPSINPTSAIDAICGSMRTTDDLIALKGGQEPAFLYAFQFDYTIQEREFRAFVKQGQLIAVTQYEGTKIRGYPESNPRGVITAIQKLAPSVIAAVPLENFIFDVYMTGYDEAETAHFLEINPWGLSDPCFFNSYENVEKGGFAYQKTDIMTL